MRSAFLRVLDAGGVDHRLASDSVDAALERIARAVVREHVARTLGLRASRRRGRPRGIARLLIADLAGVWLELCEELPGTSHRPRPKGLWRPGKGAKHYGPFVRFVMAFVEVLIVDVEDNPGSLPIPNLDKLRGDLQGLLNNPQRVREILRDLGLLEDIRKVAPQLERGDLSGKREAWLTLRWKRGY